MNKKILLTLILGILFILNLTFISANDYYIDEISINPGKTYFYSDNYQGSLIIETPSSYSISDNYQIELGFLHSDELEQGKGKIIPKDKDFTYYVYCIISFLFFLLLLLLCIIFLSGRKKKNLNK